LRRIFGLKWDEVPGEWRQLHNEEFHVLYSSPTIVRVNKTRRMRWAGYVARMGLEEAGTGLWWESLRERVHLVDAGLAGMIIFRRNFKECDVVVWTGLSWLMIKTGGGHF
jgi:hypothetical protein